MKVHDPGHTYRLNVYDTDDGIQFIHFMKREGDAYPGNLGSYPGTNCQEVLRVLIDRVLYLDNQRPCLENKAILICLRMAIWYFEVRAARRRGAKFSSPIEGIEKLPACSKCGHIKCEHLDEESHQSPEEEASGDNPSDSQVS